MCVIAFALDAVPGFRLVLLANRDEFHQRPTRPASWWTERPILAGQDLEAGGTWLGMDRSGRLAAVTNVREVPAVPGPRSRGELPLAFLSGNRSAEAEATSVLAAGSGYSGFNLVLFDGQAAAWCSNRHPQARHLTSGVYALSNHLLDTPWPKAERMRQALDGQGDEDRWLAALKDSSPAVDDCLPDTGVGLAHERMLSPVFILGETYGTRCSTLVTVTEDGHARFLEINYAPDGQETVRRQFEWMANSA